MAIELFYHPFTRAANVVWMLEEIGEEYKLLFVDLQSGAHKKEPLISLNPMGKLPTLRDGDATLSESAAIGLYLADRYAPARLAPPLDAPERATYLRWSLYAPSVIEPGLYAHREQWEFKEVTVGWGNYEAMLDAISSAIDGREFILGDQFSMADVIFGGTIRFMLQFGMLEKRPEYEAYSTRLLERPAAKRADEINAEWRAKVTPG